MSTTVNTQEIHSKLKTMAFPDFEEVVRIVQETSKGAEPTPVKSIDINGTPRKISAGRDAKPR